MRAQQLKEDLLIVLGGVFIFLIIAGFFTCKTNEAKQLKCESRGLSYSPKNNLCVSKDSIIN